VRRKGKRYSSSLLPKHATEIIHSLIGSSLSHEDKLIMTNMFLENKKMEREFDQQCGPNSLEREIL
jgi:hypothetical protein